MAGLGIDFDSSTVKPDEGRDFTLIPVGTKCLMMITGSDVKDTKGGGSMASFEATIIEGPFEKRKVWPNFTLRNSNPEAEKIGRSQLSALCRAVGHVGPLNDTTDLHDKPFIGTIGIEKGTGGYQDKNKITKFSSVNGESASTATTAPTPVGASSPPTRPWERK